MEVNKTEIWEVIEESPLYEVSTLGRFRRIDGEVLTSNGQIRRYKAKIIKPRKTTTGYWFVGPSINGKHKNMLMHSKVAKAFIPNPENKREVNHKNGDKLDNRVENLEWVTPKENAVHARTVLGTCPEAVNRKPVYCFNNGQTYISVSEAAKKLNLSQGTLAAVCRGVWPHTKKLRFKYI
jgi:hypothetical protein